MWVANCENRPREFVKGAKLEVEKFIAKYVAKFEANGHASRSFNVGGSNEGNGRQTIARVI